MPELDADRIVLDDEVIQTYGKQGGPSSSMTCHELPHLRLPTSLIPSNDAPERTFTHPSTRYYRWRELESDHRERRFNLLAANQASGNLACSLNPSYILVF